MLKLQAVELSKSYRGRKVVDDLDLEISQGEVVGLLGPNGAGKTTTFYILVGLARPDSGRVLLNGDDITDLPMYLRARSGISYLPQEPSVFRQLTVEENLIAVLETLPLTSEQQRDRLEELLAQMKLETVRSNGAYTLSGGERRRLEIARSLVLGACLHPAGRAFFGDRPFDRGGYPEDHQRIEPRGNRRPGHRPPGARNPERNQSRLHRPKRQSACRRDAGMTLAGIPKSAECISEIISV